MPKYVIINDEVMGTVEGSNPPGMLVVESDIYDLPCNLLFSKGAISRKVVVPNSPTTTPALPNPLSKHELAQGIYKHISGIDEILGEVVALLLGLSTNDLEQVQLSEKTLTDIMTRVYSSTQGNTK
jgi:hypothetical protein